jgi:hypothetical protein
MTQAIIIHTVGKCEEWCRNILSNLLNYSKYPIHIVVSDPFPIPKSFKTYLDQLPFPVYYCPQYRWEIGAIKFVNETLKFDEFVYLQHSIEVKNTELFDLLFNERHQDKSVHVFWRFMCYIGKYRKIALDKINIRVIRSKAEACMNEDWHCPTSEFKDSFMTQYYKIEPWCWLFKGFNESGDFVEKFGRMNMVVENEYLRKYKGTWQWSLIKEDEYSGCEPKS